MAGTKRTSDTDCSNIAPRASKVAKTSNATTQSKGKKDTQKSAKAVMSHSRFITNAPQFHVNLTHTTPTSDADACAATAPADPGFIGNLTLVPSNFTTGSYGWKGSKRITIEVQDPEGGPQKLQVMLTVNATVLGSKQAKSGDDNGKQLEEANLEPEIDTADEPEVGAEGGEEAD